MPEDDRINQLIEIVRQINSSLERVLVKTSLDEWEAVNLTLEKILLVTN